VKRASLGADKTAGQTHCSRRTARRETRIDEALQETFPASDPPALVTRGADGPSLDDERCRKGSAS
jgi:hypothetical protein